MSGEIYKGLTPRLASMKIMDKMMVDAAGKTLKFRRYSVPNRTIPLMDEENMQRQAEVRALREFFENVPPEERNRMDEAAFDKVHEIFAKRRAEIYESLKARYIIEHGVPEDTAREANAVDAAMDQESHTVDAMRYALLVPKP